MKYENTIVQIEDYEQFTGAEVVERVQKSARSLHNLRIAHVNSTLAGGGVAEILSALTPLMNSAGINTEWKVIEGPLEFFNITKKIHNALQGGDIHLSTAEQQLYEAVVHENAVRHQLDHDRVMIHDPQPLPLVTHYEKNSPWIWQCHIDLSTPNERVWQYLRPFVEQFNSVIFSLKEYAQALAVPQTFIMPAIDPFAPKNAKLSEAQIQKCLDDANIPTDLPIVTQISRFDPWKDPVGVIEAFKQVQKDVDATLVLLGSSASDDPEGDTIYQSLLELQQERIIILSQEDDMLVNALQSRADVVLQKSLREGFGLTVSEAMWKGTPVIGGNVGGIRKQIRDGVNGFLVSSVEETADRLLLLLQHPELCAEMGRKAHETVRERFLLIRLLDQYLELLSSFEAAQQPRHL
jgi:trehalose synthase